MTNKEFERIGSTLLPSLPGFGFKRQMLVVQPVGHTLRGVFFDRSIEARGFYAQLFVQPLYVPAQSIIFNFGWRLGGASHLWHADEPSALAQLERTLRVEAVPYLSGLASPRDVAKAGQALARPADRYVRQSIAYSLAYAGDVSDAVSALHDLTDLLDITVPWQLEMATRAADLESLLLNDVGRARQQLDAWAVESAQKLKLER